MHNFYLMIILLTIPLLSFSQENKEKPKNPYDVNFTTVTQQEPFYSSGEVALYTYLYYNIKYSEEAKTAKINGEVMVSFDVMPDSTLTGFTILGGVGKGVDEEVIRCLSALKYAPGIQNGDKVKMNVVISVPVSAK